MRPTKREREIMRGVKPRKAALEREEWFRIHPECYHVGDPAIRVRRHPGGPGVFQIKVGREQAYLYLADLAGVLDQMGLELPT